MDMLSPGLGMEQTLLQLWVFSRFAVDSQSSSRVPLDTEDSMCQLKWLSRGPLGKKILFLIIFHITSKKNHT